MQKEIVDLDGEPIEYGFEVLMRPRDAANLLCVHTATLTKWAQQGKVRFVRTEGGHRRYPQSSIRAACRGDWESAKAQVDLNTVSADDVRIHVPD